MGSVGANAAAAGRRRQGRPVRTIETPAPAALLRGIQNQEDRVRDAYRANLQQRDFALQQRLEALEETGDFLRVCHLPIPNL